MNPLLDLVPQTLGILPPLLGLSLFAVGLGRSELPRRASRRWLMGGSVLVIGWTALAWALGADGVFAYREGELIPRFLLALGVPVAALLALLKRADFRGVLDAIPLSSLVGVQAFRLLGGVFLLVPAAGLGPAAFTSAGYGDLATGSLAIVAAVAIARGASWRRYAVYAFTAVGLFDLLNVSRILLTYYPAWTPEGPTTYAATVFPMVLVPAVAAPIALALHVYVVRALLAGSSATDAAESPDAGWMGAGRRAVPFHLW